jgi:hypothetical protein
MVFIRSQYLSSALFSFEIIFTSVFFNPGYSPNKNFILSVESSDLNLLSINDTV